VKRLLIACAVAVPALAGIATAAQGGEPTTQTVTPPSKTTICHQTNSDSWRRITVSSRAWTNPKSKSGLLLRGHLRHTGDAIVVGTAVCPSATLTAAPTSTPATKITICHKTGSSTNPYRRITISSRAVTKPSSAEGKVLRAHAAHEGDILMPGTAACPPGTAAGQAKLTANLQPVQGASGSGSATFTIRLGVTQLCHTLTVSGLTNVMAAHIHRVTTGAIVVPLTTPTTGTSSGCSNTVAKALLREIAQNPGAFFVNVHTTSYPDGQIQGRLTK
jgi:CHRD domain